MGPQVPNFSGSKGRQSRKFLSSTLQVVEDRKGIFIIFGLRSHTSPSSQAVGVEWVGVGKTQLAFSIPDPIQVPQN